MVSANFQDGYCLRVKETATIYRPILLCHEPILNSSLESSKNSSDPERFWMAFTAVETHFLGMIPDLCAGLMHRQ